MVVKCENLTLFEEKTQVDRMGLFSRHLYCSLSISQEHDSVLAGQSAPAGLGWIRYPFHAVPAAFLFKFYASSKIIFFLNAPRSFAFFFLTASIFLLSNFL